MDFFVAEDRANRATLLLVILYILSIAAVVLITDAAIAYAMAVWMGGHNVTIVTSDGNSMDVTFDLMFKSLLPWVGLVVALIVVIATIMKANELRGGGTSFATLLGARFIDTPNGPDELRLKNVVDEMALAAGVRAPQVCVLDNEPGINAFAAGTNNRDPVIGVTAGCLTLLTRDELQGIVGHEFSHILHNDTVLNTRAYAMLFGLLAISVIGVKMLGASFYVDDDRPGRNNGGGIPFLVIGLIMMVVGWLGGLAGRLVRAAMVRQREFLADASAVQYTRNADGVAAALYKMGTHGSHLCHPTGEEAEHFLFGSGAGSAWGRFGLTRTHPQTADRIKAIRPGFQPSDANAIPLSKIDDDANVGLGTALQGSMGIDPDETTIFVGVLPPGSGQAEVQAALKNKSVRILMPGEDPMGLPTFTLGDLRAAAHNARSGAGAQPNASSGLVSDVAMLFPLAGSMGGSAAAAEALAGSQTGGGSMGTTSNTPVGAGTGETDGEPVGPVEPEGTVGTATGQPAAESAASADLDAALETAQPTGRPAGTGSATPPAGPVFAPPKPPDGLLAKIPDDLRTVDDKSAAAICFALAAADLPPDKWESILSSFADDDTTNQVNKALPEIKALTLKPRMALLDIVVSGLQTLPEEERTALDEAVTSLLSLTDQPDIVALGVYWRLVRYLGYTPADAPKAATWAEGSAHVAALLGTVANLQFGPGVLAPKAYETAGKDFAALGSFPPMPAPGSVRPSNIHTALMVLMNASAATRDLVVTSAARIISEEEIPETHADLLVRMICDAADHDIPDFFDRWV